MELFSQLTPSILIAIALSITISVLTYLLHKSKYSLWKNQGVAGPNQWPVIGNITEALFSKSMLDAMDQRYKKYGPVYGMYLFFMPQLVVGDVDMLKDILVRDWHVFADRQNGRKTGDPIIDRFLTSLTGNEWKRMRSVMSPTFTSGKMKQMFHIMNDCCRLMTENIRKRIQRENNQNHNGQSLELDMRHLSGCYTMDVIAKCCFATDTNSFDDPNEVFVTQAKKFFDITKLRVFLAILSIVIPQWLKKMIRFKNPFKESLDFFGGVAKVILEKRRREGNSNEQLRGAKDYLQLLIDASKDQNSNLISSEKEQVPDHESHHGYEDGNEKVNQTMITNDLKRPLSDEEIIASSVLFLSVGYDTTGSLITMTAYLLALNPEKQQKLFEEVKNAQEENSGKFNYETISGLKYLDAVISETLRLLPSATAIERRSLEDYTFQKNGIFIPKTTSIMLPIWNMHHDQRFWTDPMKFEPERFLPENRDKIVPYSYIPFGGGPRNCIGMRFALLEAKLAIANLVLNFEFSPCSKTDVPLDLSPTMGLINAKRVFVGVQNRNNNV